MNVRTPPVTPSPPVFGGVDVGGTNTKIGLVDDLGQTLAFASIPTEESRGPGDAMRRSAAKLDELVDEAPIDRADLKWVGLGTPGTMDIPSGKVLEPPNLPHWRDFGVRDLLAECVGVPVAFVNDANAAAYGEFWMGSGRDHDSMVMFTLGTGVGGGIILDGRLIHGANSFGSECGHIVIDYHDDARLCVWGGGRGELEAYCSASALVARVRELLKEGRPSALAKDLSSERLTARRVAEVAEAGDELARDVVLETATLLGVGVVSIVHTIDPGMVVLGGAMNFGGHETSIGREFLATVRSSFRERAFHVVRDCTSIDFAALGGAAGYIGAAGIARQASA